MRSKFQTFITADAYLRKILTFSARLDLFLIQSGANQINKSFLNGSDFSLCKHIKSFTDASNQNRRLLNKPYWNRGTLSQDYTHKKSFKSLGLCPPNRYEIDLSNEVLNIDFGQGAAKIPEVKSGVRKKYLPTWLTLGTRVRTGPLGRYFFQTLTLTSGIFAAP